MYVLCSVSFTIVGLVSCRPCFCTCISFTREQFRCLCLTMKFCLDAADASVVPCRSWNFYKKAPQTESSIDRYLQNSWPVNYRQKSWTDTSIGDESDASIYRESVYWRSVLWREIYCIESYSTKYQFLFLFLFLEHRGCCSSHLYRFDRSFWFEFRKTRSSTPVGDSSDQVVYKRPHVGNLWVIWESLAGTYAAANPNKNRRFDSMSETTARSSINNAEIVRTS